MDGYGRFSSTSDGRRGVRQAHRIALEALLGRRLDAHEVACHHCDNPSCVRPDHLYAGSTLTNARDAVARGQQPRGERHGLAKLTADRVREIRDWYATGSWTQRGLARHFGVSQAVVNDIIVGRTWRHVDPTVAMGRVGRWWQRTMRAA